MEKKIKPLKRLMEASNGSINSIAELLSMMGDEALKRMERKLKLKIEEIDNSANFITDEEKDLLIEIYNRILIIGGDRGLWDVYKYQYVEDDDDVQFTLRTIESGDIGNTELEVLYRGLNFGSPQTRAILKDAIAKKILSNTNIKN